MIRICVYIAVASCLLVNAASANLITNGTFDTSVPSNGTGGGWTSSNIDFNGGWQSSAGNPGAFFAINDGVQTDVKPTIEQTLTGLNIGTTYSVTGDFKVNLLIQNGSADSFEVLLDGIAIKTFDQPGPKGQWFGFTANFTATDTSHTIGFAAEANGTDTDYGVDNIAVVPEPVTVVMLGLGGAALLRCRRPGPDRPQTIPSAGRGDFSTTPAS